ncbi:MAG: ABC transporter permease subunit [Defluviitaleaceae bacterium]|nr:ABC transporter permease subunit [Defluviitaleaceae bacterium]
MSKQHLTKRIARYKIIYLMMLPGFLLTLVLAYFPMGGLYMAFSYFRIGRPLFEAEFAGLTFFRYVIRDSTLMLEVLRNTLAMNILSILVGLTVALFFSIMLNEVGNRHIKKIIQSVSFMPFFLSWVIVYNIMQVFLSAGTGIINVFLMDLGVIDHGIMFLSDPSLSWPLVVLSNLWRMLGYNAVIFLSSIAGIDTGLYEAANIDGADRLHRIRYITLPALLPTFQILLILNFGWVFSSNFEQFFLFTNAMNRPTMEVFDMFIFRFGMRQLNFSYATAVGILRSVAGFILLIIVNQISKRMEGSSVA